MKRCKRLLKIVKAKWRMEFSVKNSLSIYRASFRFPFLSLRRRLHFQVQQSAGRIMRAIFEICLRRGARRERKTEEKKERQGKNRKTQKEQIKRRKRQRPFFGREDY